MLLMIVLPSSIVLCFGEMIGNRRQGWVLYGVMGALLLLFLPVVIVPEQAGTPLLAKAGIETAASSTQPGGNMEGKEVRFGIVQSGLFGLVTTTFTTGSVNSMHDSFTPLGGMGTFIGMMLQCVFGGKGVGFLAALVYGIIAVFIAGLMVGRTPEFLGKKIEKPEIVLVSLTLLIHPLVILAPTGWSMVAPYGVASLGNAAMHGYSEVLYAFTSSAANNGSAFAGLQCKHPLVQFGHCRRHPHRPLSTDHLHDGGGRIGGGETHGAGYTRHAAHGQLEVRDHSGWSPSWWWVRSRSSRRSSWDRSLSSSPCRAVSSSDPHAPTLGPWNNEHERSAPEVSLRQNVSPRRRRASRRAVEAYGADLLAAGCSRFAQEIRSADADPQSRDVRGLARRTGDRRAHDRSGVFRTLKRIARPTTAS